VRISIDPEQLKRIPLRLGLSMNVSVDLHDTEGLMVPIKIPEASMYNTDVFNNQMDGVENLIDSIFDQNETLEID
jgi:membrane fusion protein (multidrug efflux system)